MSRPRAIETRTTTLEASQPHVVSVAQGDGNTLVGYAIRFDEETLIRESGREFRERISPGALTKTLEERGRNVTIQFDHGQHPTIGSLPLGKPSVLRADDKGLWVEVPLTETFYSSTIANLIRDGALSGMSFRFTVLNDRWEHPKGDLPRREIRELKLIELGPVVHPSYLTTSVGMRERLSPERAAALAKLKAFAEGPPVSGKATPMRRKWRPTSRGKTSTTRLPSSVLEPPELTDLLAVAAKANLKR